MSLYIVGLYCHEKLTEIAYTHRYNKDYRYTGGTVIYCAMASNEMSASNGVNKQFEERRCISLHAALSQNRIHTTY